MKPCGDTFKGTGFQSFENWLCPDYDGAPLEHLNFQGEWFSQTFAYIDIKLTVCTEGATNPLTEQPFVGCKSPTEIEKVLQGSNLNLVYFDGYLDIEEPEELLKHYQHSSAFVSFEMDKRKNMDVFFRLG